MKVKKVLLFTEYERVCYMQEDQERDYLSKDDYLNRDDYSKLGERESLMVDDRRPQPKISISPFSINVVDFGGITQDGITDEKKSLEQTEGEKELTAFEKHDLEFKKLSQDAQRMKNQRGGGIYCGDSAKEESLFVRGKAEVLDFIDTLLNPSDKATLSLIIVVMSLLLLMSVEFFKSVIPIYVYLFFVYLVIANLSGSDVPSLIEKMKSSKWWQLKEKKKELI